MRHYSLALEDLTIPVHLGCLEDERALPQMVVIDLIISFMEKPKACLSDDINDAICYATLARAMQNFCADKSFRLIENLGYQLHQFVKEQLPKNVKVSLQVRKTPPIANLSHAVFSVED